MNVNVQLALQVGLSVGLTIFSSGIGRGTGEKLAKSQTSHKPTQNICGHLGATLGEFIPVVLLRINPLAQVLALIFSLGLSIVRSTNRNLRNLPISLLGGGLGAGLAFVLRSPTIGAAAGISLIYLGKLFMNFKGKKP